MIINRFLNILDHQNHIFLQFNWMLVPMWFVYTIRHVLITLWRNFAKIAIEKQIWHVCSKCHQNSNQTEFQVMHLLKTKTKSNYFFDQILNVWLNKYQINLKKSRSQSNYGANQMNQNILPIHISRFYEPTAMTFNSMVIKILSLIFVSIEVFTF